MEAKDTIMTRKQIDEMWMELWNENIYGKGKNEPPSLEEYSRAYESKQAEISFKAGRREVVEWIRSNGTESIIGLDIGIRTINLSKEQWQAQLKDWFKDNPELLKEWGIK